MYQKVYTILTNIIFISTLFLSACSQERLTPIVVEPIVQPTTPPTPEPPVVPEAPVFVTSTEATFDKWAETPTKKIINSAADLPMIGKKGTKVWAYNYNCLYQNDALVSYPFEIELIELFSPKDMILNKMPTVSDDRMLVTGGEIKLTITKDGKPLKSSTRLPIQITIPSANPDPAMVLFYGEQNQGTDIVNWKTSSAITVIQRDTTVIQLPKDSVIEKESEIFPGKSLYTLFPKQIGWINCDKFYDFTGAKTKINFTSTVDLAKIYKFLYFDDLKSVINVYGNTSLDVPVGKHVKVICFSITKEKVLYTFTKELNVEAGQTIAIELKETSEAVFMKYLDSL